MNLGFIVRVLACLAAQGVFVPLDAPATASGATPQPFDRYQPILDRMPFGAPPPEAPPEVSPEQAKNVAEVQAEQQKLAKQINMSCINVTPGGKTAIGFTDLNEKPPKNYYLLTGDSGGGWTVVNADYDEEWAQIEKDGVTITLKLGKGLIDGPPAQEPAMKAKPTALAQNPMVNTGAMTNRFGLIRRPSYGGRPTLNLAELQRTRLENLQVREDIATLKDAGGDVKSYMARLHERKAQEQADKKAAEEAARQELQALAQKITAEEFEKKEREVNLYLIEQGAKPISDIELTPEEEADLVEKGVLSQ